MDKVPNMVGEEFLLSQAQLVANTINFRLGLASETGHYEVMAHDLHDDDWPEYRYGLYWVPADTTKSYTRVIRTDTIDRMLSMVHGINAFLLSDSFRTEGKR